MEEIEIVYYRIEHQITRGTTFYLYLRNRDVKTLRDLPLEEAMFITDILRNERPLSFNMRTGTIATSRLEPTGENE